MKLIIQKAGTYNDARNHAHRLQPGDELDTGLEYGQSLIASGFAIAGNVVVYEPPVSDSEQPSDNTRKGNADEADPNVVKEIDLSDGADDDEATFASKTLATRKRTKKA
jgi:hypothetical protein